MREGWKLKPWKQVLEIRSGRNQKDVLNPKGKYQIIGSAGKIMGYADDYICEAGTTIVGRKGTINNPLFIDERFWNVDTAFGLHSFEGLDKYYLHYFCLGFDFSKMDRGSGRPSLVKSDLLKIKIPIPPLSEQKQIVALLDQAFAAIEQAKANIERNIENAKELFQSKLNAIFSQRGEGWEEKTFQELSSRIGDGLHGTPEYDENGDYYFINGSNLNNGIIEIKENTKKVNKKEFEKHERNLTDNTVLVSINGTLGKVAFYSGEPVILGKSACYINFNEEVDKYYIKYLVQSPLFFDNMAEMSTGATIKNFSLKSMRNYSLQLPSLSEQKSRIETLSNIEKNISIMIVNYEKRLKHLEELKNSILQKAFSGELTGKSTVESK